MNLRGLHIRVSLICLVICYLLPVLVSAQSVIEVVTKTIEKDLPCGTYGALRITGEKSEIEIHGWDKKNMHIKVQLISENKDRKSAEEELDYLHFSLNNEPNLVELSNTFIFPNWHVSIHGNLKTRYEVWVPRQYLISIINKFGFIKLYDLKTRTMIDAEYSNIKIDHFDGYLSVKSSYSDLYAINIHSELECNADHADINLHSNGGKYHIEDKFGKISLTAYNTLDLVNIRASSTPVTIVTNGMDHYDLDISNSNANILLPDHKYDSDIKHFANHSTFRLKQKDKPQISIVTSYENIDIK